MRSVLASLPTGQPGWLGLNKQRSGGSIESGWATVAYNMVVDDRGRLAARLGTRAVASAVIPTATEMQTLHSYVDKSGNEVTLGTADNKIFRLDSGTWTDVSGTITTPTANNWQFQNFNGKVIGWQYNHAPIVMSTVAGTFADIVAGTGTVPTGVAVLAAWGRVWVLDNDTLYWSDLLDETGWAGASAGSLLLTNVWPGGVDTPVALAEYNGFLVIFGKTQTLVYQGPDDPASPFGNFIKIEGINGVGCTARDSVVNTGGELVFLSALGLQTLARVIQEKSMPLGSVAPQIRDYLLSEAVDADKDDIKAAFAQRHGFYIITLPTLVLVMDLRQRLNDGSYRVTEWSPDFKAVASDSDGKLYLSNGANAFEYRSYYDEIAYDGTGGVDISFVFEGAWQDFGDVVPEVASRVKHLKRLKLYAAGGSGHTFQLKFAFDYATSFQQRQVTLPSGSESRWGVAHYSVDNYSGDFGFSAKSANGARSGRVLKLGLEGSVGGVPFALDRIDAMATVGKLST